VRVTAATLWECLTTGPALIDYFVMYHYAQIYKTLYFYWAPLCYVPRLKEQKSMPLNLIEFPIEPLWLSSEWD
jgi:hypothetical protein